MAAVAKVVWKGLMALGVKPESIAKAILFGIVALLALLLFLISPAAMIKHVPLANDQQQGFYIQAAAEVEMQTKVSVNWMEIMAIDAVLLNQDFKNANYEHALNLAWKFIRKEERKIEVEETDPETGEKKTRTKTVIVYHPVPLDTVLQNLVREKVLAANQIDRVHDYLVLSIGSGVWNGESLPSDWTPKNGDFLWPVPNSYVVTDGYRSRVNPVTGQAELHKGLDVGGPQGMPIVTARDGKVMFAGWAGNAGNMVLIAHGNGYQTRYLHMAYVRVKTGQTLKKGDTIGGMGTTGQSTGVHLHFEILVNGRATNPLPFFK